MRCVTVVADVWTAAPPTGDRQLKGSHCRGCEMKIAGR